MAGILEYSSTPASNTTINGIGISGSSSIKYGDDAIRQFMADVRSAVTKASDKAAGTHMATKADHNQLWRVTGTATINLTSAATLTAGWALWVMADGGTVTIDPASSEQINGAATLTIQDGAAAFIICTATAFRALPIGTGDMLASVYDPQSIVADAFDRSNHTGVMPLSGLDSSSSGAGVVGRSNASGDYARLTLASAATANSVPYRGAGGVLAVGTPTAAAHAATKKYVDENAGGLGVGQTWTDVTSSRAIGTTYQNTTGKVIAVSVNLRGDTTFSIGALDISGDGSSWGPLARASGQYDTLFAIIRPNEYYRVRRVSNEYAINIIGWMELR